MMKNNKEPKILEQISLLFLVVFLFTFTFFYPYSFWLGLITLITYATLFIVKRKNSNIFNTIILLFILEQISLLSVIKISLLKYSLYSCTLMHNYSEETIELLDKSFKLRTLITEQIIDCDIKEGKNILISNIKNPYYDNHAIEYESYYYVKNPFGKKLFQTSKDKISEWENKKL